MPGRQYEIHIEGHLRPDWAEWLDCMKMCWLENGEMILRGTIIDQAALLGILNKLNSLNLCILSVKEVGRKGTAQESGHKAASESEGQTNQ